MTAYNLDGTPLIDHPDLTPEQLAAGRAAVIADRAATAAKAAALPPTTEVRVSAVETSVADLDAIIVAALS